MPDAQWVDETADPGPSLMDRLRDSRGSRTRRAAARKERAERWAQHRASMPRLESIRKGSRDRTLAGKKRVKARKAEQRANRE